MQQGDGFINWREYLLLHEIGHMVHYKCVGIKNIDVKNFYKNSTEYSTLYASKNYLEYFAESFTLNSLGYKLKTLVSFDSSFKLKTTF